MGNLEPMMDLTRLLLVGRGYQPDFAPDVWRRLAYVMIQASLEAYSGMEARQEGLVVASLWMSSCHALLPSSVGSTS